MGLSSLGPGQLDVILRQAVVHKFMGIRPDAMEVLMRRPRFVFSLGIALLPIAFFSFIFMTGVLWNEHRLFDVENGTVVMAGLEQQSPTGGATVYGPWARVKIIRGGKPQYSTTRIWTRDAEKRDEFLRRYVVGSQHLFRFSKTQPELAWPGDDGRAMVLQFFGIGSAFLLLAGGLVYVGKKKSV